MIVEPANSARLISPRIFAVITTQNSDDSTNASPYSWVFPFSYNPPLIGIGVGKGGKNTQKNAEKAGEFVVNLVSEDWGQEACDLEKNHGKNQLGEVGLSEAESRVVKVKGVNEAKTRFECRLVKTMEVTDKGDHVFLIGEIVAAECGEMNGNAVDLEKLAPLMHASGAEFRKVGGKILLERGRVW